MSNIKRIDTDSYVYVQGPLAVVNQGSGYAIINIQTKEVIAHNISSFLDSVKTIEHLLGIAKSQSLTSIPVQVLPVQSPTISQPVNQPTSRQHYQLDELDLACIRGSSNYFKEMSAKILQYHRDHGASQEEAGVIARYYLEAADKASNVRNQHDFKDVFKFIQDLRFKVSRYKHKSNDGKYGWAVSLDKEVIAKLSLIANHLS